MDYENNYPSNMIDNDGNKKYAYITFLIINELYVPASIILAESLKKIGSLSELVIMIDENISNETIELLKKFYDRIIKIEKIEIEHKDNTQKYILTKLEALKLDYIKIIIIDIDSIILKYPDNSFSLPSPSVIYVDNVVKSGYIVIEPDKNLYEEIVDKLKDEKVKDRLKEEIKPFNYII